MRSRRRTADVGISKAACTCGGEDSEFASVATSCWFLPSILFCRPGALGPIVRFL